MNLKFLFDNIKKKYSSVIVFTSKGNCVRLELIDLINSDNDYLYSDLNANPNITTLKKIINKSNNFKAIVGIGGGSVIDYCKLYKCFFNEKTIDIKKKINDKSYTNILDIPIIVVPTLYGSGAEKTQFAVCYVDGFKNSISHPLLKPDKVIYTPQITYSIPQKVKRDNIIDCFCQSFESLSSISRTFESEIFAKKSLEILKNYSFKYVIDWDLNSAKQLGNASELCGKAINFSKTTAPHALSYYLTSQLGISHGESLSITYPFIINQYLISKSENTEINNILDYSLKFFDCTKSELLMNIINYFESLGLNYLYLINLIKKKINIELWFKSVNKERLFNGPSLNEYKIDTISFDKFIFEISNTLKCRKN